LWKIRLNWKFMRLPTFTEYLEARSRFAVPRDLAQGALTWAQPFALEALGVHTQRQTLIDGELPAYVVPTTPATNGGWGELMPLWFKPYDRPVPLYCLDNWALFAQLYRSAFGADASASASAFTIEHLVQVVVGADLLIPFLPGTDGAGRFLRHGALPILLAMLWLEPEARDAWLALHECGARGFAVENDLDRGSNLSEYLERVEQEAWIAAENAGIAGEAAVSAYLADADRARQYAQLFGGLCVGVTALATAYGIEWREWIFQAVNVAYRLPDFGLAPIAAWLDRQ
jgi:hypothetical protein